MCVTLILVLIGLLIFLFIFFFWFFVSPWYARLGKVGFTVSVFVLTILVVCWLLFFHRVMFFNIECGVFLFDILIPFYLIFGFLSLFLVLFLFGLLMWGFPPTLLCGLWVCLLSSFDGDALMLMISGLFRLSRLWYFGIICSVIRLCLFIVVVHLVLHDFTHIFVLILFVFWVFCWNRSVVY